MDGVTYGNAQVEGQSGERRGWFFGHFLPPGDPRCSRDVEVKWGVHARGEEKTVPAFNQTASTLSILVSGQFLVRFLPGGEQVLLSQPGDYVLFAPGLGHTWQAVEDTVIITVRWPSLPGDQQAAG